MNAFERNLKHNTVRALAMSARVQKATEGIVMNAESLDDLAAQAHTAATLWEIVAERAKGIALEMMENDEGG